MGTSTTGMQGGTASSRDIGTGIRRGLGVLVLACAGLAGCTCGSNRGSSSSGQRQGPAVVMVDPDEEQGPVALTEKEPNDDRPTAQPLAAGERIMGRLSSGAPDLDWYRLQIEEEDRILTASVSGVAGMDLSLEALDAKGNRRVRVNNNPIGGGEVLVNLAVDRGTTYLRVREVKGRGSEATYTLDFRLRAREEGEELEPNWKAALATPLALDAEAMGYLGWATDADWFQVDATSLSPSHRLRAEFDGVDQVRAGLQVRDAAGQVLGEAWSTAGNSVLLQNIVPPTAARNPLFVVLRCANQANVENRYYLRIQANIPTGPTEGEPNDEPGRATALEPGQTMSGSLDHDRDLDHFLVRTDVPITLTVRASPPLGQDLELALVGQQAGRKPLLVANEAGVRQAEVLPALAVQPPGALLRLRPIRLDPDTPAGAYQLLARPEEGGELEQEPNNSPTQATSWPVGQVRVRGFLHPSGDIDYFRRVAAEERLRLAYQPVKGTASTIQVIGPASEVLAQADSASDGVPLVVEAAVQPGMDLLIRIVETGGKGQAELAYTLSSGAP